MTPCERFEAIGDLYYRATGYLRPGKAEPPETGREPNSDENRGRFEQWLATRGFSDAIDRIVELRQEVSDLRKANGAAGDRVVAALDRAIDAEAEAERLRAENDRLAAEVDAWKDASGLLAGGEHGDPDGVTPAASRRYWEKVEADLTAAQERVRELEAMLSKARVPADHSGTFMDGRSMGNLVEERWEKIK